MFNGKLKNFFFGKKIMKFVGNIFVACEDVFWKLMKLFRIFLEFWGKLHKQQFRIMFGVKVSSFI